MTRQEMEVEVERLLLKQRAFARFSIELPPNERLLLERLLYRLGLTGRVSMSRRKLTVGNTAASTSPHKYAKVPTSEGGTLTPEQLQILQRAHSTSDNTGWGALGDHLAESGYPNAGAVLSKMVSLPDGSVNHAANPVGRASFPRRAGQFTYAAIRDGVNLLHYLRINDGEVVHTFSHLIDPSRMTRRGTARKYSTADHRAFHDAIIESPRDETNHLVYADYLQDEGKDAHAEFIRRAVENARQDWSRRVGFTTMHAPPNLTGDFSVNGMYTGAVSNGWNLDLSNQREATDGQRFVWTLPGMTAVEARQLHDRLVAEGAASTIDEALPKSAPAPKQMRRHKVTRRYAFDERTQFEKAIDANPEDSLTHGVYADWLDDHGEHSEAAFRRAMGEWISHGIYEHFRSGPARPHPNDHAVIPQQHEKWLIEEGQQGPGGFQVNVRSLPPGDRRPIATLEDERARDSDPERAWVWEHGNHSWPTYRAMERDLRHGYEHHVNSGHNHNAPMGKPDRMKRRVIPRRFAKAEKDRHPAHSILEGTPISHALRHLANDPTANDNLRSTAKHVLTTGDTSGLWAIHDLVQQHENVDGTTGHPILKAGYNFMSAADKLHLDRHTHDALTAEGNEARRTALWEVTHNPDWTYGPHHTALRAGQGLNRGTQYPTQFHENRQLLDRVRQRIKNAAPHADDEGVDKSIRRAIHLAHNELSKEAGGTFAVEDYPHQALRPVGSERMPDSFKYKPNPEQVKNEKATRFRRKVVKFSKTNRSDFVSALQKMQSSNHSALTTAATDVAGRMGIQDTHVLPALHDAPGGSVPGVAQAIYGPTPPEKVHELASWVNGLLPNSPGYAVFHPRPTGPDTLYRMRHNGSGMDVRARLDRAGIKSRVLIPHRRGFDVIIPDKGNRLQQQVAQYAQQQGLQVEASPGHFQTVGGATQQSGNREQFRNKVVKGEQTRMSRKVVRYNRDDELGFVKRLNDEHPDDQTTGLVYADYIQDHGHESTANLIRQAMHEQGAAYTNYSPVVNQTPTTRNIIAPDLYYHLSLRHPVKGEVEIHVTPNFTGGDIDPDHPYSDRPVVRFGTRVTPELAHKFADGLPTEMANEMKDVLKSWGYKRPYRPEQSKLSRTKPKHEQPRPRQMSRRGAVVKFGRELNGSLVAGVLAPKKSRGVNRDTIDKTALGALGDHLQEIGSPIGHIVSHVARGGLTTQAIRSMSGDTIADEKTEDGVHQVIARRGTGRDGKPLTWVSISQLKPIKLDNGNTRLDKDKSYEFGVYDHELPGGTAQPQQMSRQSFPKKSRRQLCQS